MYLMPKQHMFFVIQKINELIGIGTITDKDENISDLFD